MAKSSGAPPLPSFTGEGRGEGGAGRGDNCAAERTLIRPSGTFSREGREKEKNYNASVTALSPDLRSAVISGGHGYQLVDIASGKATDVDRGLYTFAIAAG